MKYLYAATMLLSLVSVGILIALGHDYVTVGQGLHPAAAFGLAVVSISCGYIAACRIGDE